MFTLRFYNLFFNILFTIMALLLLIDELLPVDIDSQVVKRLVYICLLVFTPASILWNLIFVKGKQKWFSLILPAIIGGLFLRYGVLAVLFSTGTWSTQDILYRKEGFIEQRVEFQMQDVGALGYNRRTVKVMHITPLFMVHTAVPENVDIDPEWKKVNEYVNELELKDP